MSYDPKSPPYNPNSSSSNNPPSPPYRPGPEEEYDPTDPALNRPGVKSESASVAKTYFDLVGNPYQPTNLCDIARPLIVKSVRCNMCGDAIGIQAFVAAFLLRRKEETDVPSSVRDKPFFWSQGYCHRDNYTFATKVFIPSELYAYCTMKRWPPASMLSKDVLDKYSNGVERLTTASDRGPVEHRETKQRNPRPYRDYRDSRDGRRDERRDERRDRDYDRDRRAPRDRSRSPDRGAHAPSWDPWNRRDQLGYPPSPPRSPRSREAPAHILSRMESRSNRGNPYDRYEQRDRNNRNNRTNTTQYASVTNPGQSSQSYQPSIPAPESYQHYVPQLQEPIPAPYRISDRSVEDTRTNSV